MQKMFEILYVEKHSAIVINKTYCTISCFLNELEMELERDNFQGNILFDLLLSNGLYSKNRFMSTTFNNFRLDDNIQIKEELETYYLMKISSFYKRNIAILKSGILQKSEIDLLKKHLESI